MRAHLKARLALAVASLVLFARLAHGSSRFLEGSDAIELQVRPQPRGDPSDSWRPAVHDEADEPAFAGRVAHLSEQEIPWLGARIRAGDRFGRRASQPN